jgi:hypothetical protein
VSADKDDQSWIQHVTVEFAADGARQRGRAPVFDTGAYEPGQTVDVLYDTNGRVMLDEERYDASSPAFFASALLAGGVLPIVFGWWWVRRVQRIASGTGPTFAMQVRVAETRPRWWNLRRPWVTIVPLDSSDDAVGSYPLMARVPVALESGPIGEVKGHVRDGGLVVAQAGWVLWPRGRLRT